MKSHLYFIIFFLYLILNVVNFITISSLLYRCCGGLLSASVWFKLHVCVVYTSVLLSWVTGRVTWEGAAVPSLNNLFHSHLYTYKNSIGPTHLIWVFRSYYNPWQGQSQDAVQPLVTIYPRHCQEISVYTRRLPLYPERPPVVGCLDSS